jgi:integrase
MARTIRRLKALQIPRLRQPGLYADGGGLYLQVKRGGAQSWTYRFMLHGKAREMGLGSAALCSLAEARAKADAARRLRADGVDPIRARRAVADAARAPRARQVTFRECAEALIAGKRPGWRNAVHADQWPSSLATYAYPVLGDLPVAAIDIGLVLKVLEPIWTSRTETASRVRGRIEAVLDWARVRGYRNGDNPARWRGHLDHLLPARSKVQPVVHHAALPYAELPALMAAIRHEPGLPTSAGRAALAFAILTAARSGEVRHATWSEIDLANRLWTAPGSRMKTGKEHRVPLSQTALAILAARRVAVGTAAGLRAIAPADFVFAGRHGRPLGHAAMRHTLQQLARRAGASQRAGNAVTVHGCRSSFRDWAAETTGFASEVVEMALAHAVGSKVEAAYRRGDLLDKRRQLMDAWAAYLRDGAVAPHAGADSGNRDRGDIVDLELDDTTATPNPQAG